MRKLSIALTFGAALMLSSALAAKAADAPATTTPPAATAAPAAKTAPTKGPGKHNRIAGPVSAVDATAKTVTVTAKDGTATTFTVDAATSVLVGATGTVANIGATDRIRVDAATDIADGSTTVIATNIEVLQPVKATGKGKGKAKGTGYIKNHVIGDVVTLSPLTIKTESGVTVAVTTDATTPVHYSTAGTFTNIVVGDRIMAELTGEAPALTAKTVIIAPAKEKPTKGHRKNK